MPFIITIVSVLLFSTLGWVRQSVPSRKFGVKIFLFSPAAGTAAPRGGGGSAGGDTACCMQCCSSGHCSLQTHSPRPVLQCFVVMWQHITSNGWILTVSARVL